MLKAAARLFQVNLLALVGLLAGFYEFVRSLLSLREACDEGVLPNGLPMN